MQFFYETLLTNNLFPDQFILEDFYIIMQAFYYFILKYSVIRFLILNYL